MLRTALTAMQAGIYMAWLDVLQIFNTDCVIELTLLMIAAHTCAQFGTQCRFDWLQDLWR